HFGGEATSAIGANGTVLVEQPLPRLSVGVAAGRVRSERRRMMARCARTSPALGARTRTLGRSFGGAGDDHRLRRGRSLRRMRLGFFLAGGPTGGAGVPRSCCLGMRRRGVVIRRIVWRL